MKLLLVDGTNVLMRCAAVVCRDVFLPTFEEEEKAINMAAGMVLRACDELGASHVVVAWDDSDHESERAKIAPEYKANRVGRTARWVSLARPLFASRGLWSVTAPGWEADDVVATLATRVPQNATTQVMVLSGDSDLLALADVATCYRFGTKRGEPWIVEMTPDMVKQKFGVPPAWLTTLKALAGEPSDNIEGPWGKHCVAKARKHLAVVPPSERDPLGFLCASGILFGESATTAQRAHAVLALRLTLALPPILPSACRVPVHEQNR